jgi:phosphonate degradation associated HDIG domain protein
MNAPVHPVLAQIQALFDERGSLVYGEMVTQLEHALQCGTFAAQEQAHPALVLATFLHDIGHMQHQDAASAIEQGRDDAHEVLGAKWLARWFGPEVSEPVRLHVQAKRYLCKVQTGYLDSLSPLSLRTLQIQGGPMTDEEAQTFEQQPFYEDAVRLRRWDEAGKETQMQTMPFENFMQLAAGQLT